MSLYFRFIEKRYWNFIREFSIIIFFSEARIKWWNVCTTFSTPKINEMIMQHFNRNFNQTSPWCVTWTFLHQCRWQLTNADNYTNINGIIPPPHEWEIDPQWQAAVRNDKLRRHAVAEIPERPRWREDFDKAQEEDANYAAARI